MLNGSEWPRIPAQLLSPKSAEGDREWSASAEVGAGREGEAAGKEPFSGSRPAEGPKEARRRWWPTLTSGRGPPAGRTGDVFSRASLENPARAKGMWDRNISLASPRMSHPSREERHVLSRMEEAEQGPQSPGPPPRGPWGAAGGRLGFCGWCRRHPARPETPPRRDDFSGRVFSFPASLPTTPPTQAATGVLRAAGRHTLGDTDSAAAGCKNNAGAERRELDEAPHGATVVLNEEGARGEARRAPHPKRPRSLSLPLTLKTGDLGEAGVLPSSDSCPRSLLSSEPRSRFLLPLRCKLGSSRPRTEDCPPAGLGQEGLRSGTN